MKVEKPAECEMAYIGFMVPRELAHRVRVICAKRDKHVSEEMRRMVEAYVTRMEAWEKRKE